jgi:hypothetical protein
MGRSFRCRKPKAKCLYKWPHYMTAFHSRVAYCTCRGGPSGGIPAPTCFPKQRGVWADGNEKSIRGRSAVGNRNAATAANTTRPESASGRGGEDHSQGGLEGYDSRELLSAVGHLRVERSGAIVQVLERRSAKEETSWQEAVRAKRAG